MRPARLGAFLLGVVLLASAVFNATPARADGDEAEGRRRWKQGQELYAQGKYLDAAKEFEAGYAVAPRPLFLLNIGHAYRRARELAKAKTAYETLLKMQPDLPQRAEVESYIKGIDDALQASESIKAGEGTKSDDKRPAGTAEGGTTTTIPPSLLGDSTTNGSAFGAGSAQQSQPNPFQVNAGATPVHEETQASHGSVLRKPWFWVIVGAVIAGGVAGVVVATRPSKPCTATLCIVEK